jgi:cell wall-associated NlpC family hydrolase
MPLYRSTAAVLLVAASIPALASAPWSPAPACESAAQQTLYSLGLEPDGDAAAANPESALADLARAAEPQRREAAPRELLAAFAMTLRDIRYRHGGRSPKTGFDCSGFVQYVFAHSLGIELPDTSITQFQDGAGVTRNELQTGDLVFFHTRGKRVSHVGIYLGNGLFIHSPSTGKRVRVDELKDRYWAQRYVGAKRPGVLTQGVSRT